MTEKQGGSDVRANTTRRPAAERRRPRRRVRAHRPQVVLLGARCATSFLVLAQADGGVSCFLFPRWTPDGERNSFRLQRLKDKLGNRSNASSEIEFDGAWARLVGEEGARRADDHRDGQPHAARLRPSAIGDRDARGVAQAINHAAHRSAFGKPLVEQPLMRNVLADLAIESEAATISAMRLARAYDEATPATTSAQAFKRSRHRGAQVLDLQARARARRRVRSSAWAATATSRSRACRGSTARRPLASIWEGSGNVQCLDVLRAMVKSPESLEAFFAEVPRRPSEPTASAAEAKALARGAPRHDRRSRPARAASSSAWRCCLQGSLLVRYGDEAVGRRLLRLAPGRRLGPARSARSPPAPTSPASSSATARLRSASPWPG